MQTARWLLLCAVSIIGGSSCTREPSARQKVSGDPGATAASWAFGEALPGAPSFDTALAEKLESAWADRPAGYEPRTRHKRPDGSPRYTNRLFLESSPYLRQHAHNPVSWYPWGDEAFAAAKALGRPVLLSVGYSTCHWCHVMEEESFEDEEIARYLNEHYIAIKVDREERPDIDAIYMNAVIALTGSGGWPMTVWVTPDRRPFYGGSYFPARDGDRGARVGFLTLLIKIRDAYDREPQRVADSAAGLVNVIQERLSPSSSSDALPGPEVLDGAFASYRGRFDADYGGLRGAPKFPSTLPIRFLLRTWRRTGDAAALRMARLTLEKMAAGGMYDHVGGGFHRYSTDAKWLIPHFEKMLYDNALLAVAYLEAYQATGDHDFARVAREILRYVERDMTSPEGGFYAATDADSPGPDGRRGEGWFFTWTPGELEIVLGAERARWIASYYDVTAAGNFAGRNVLSTPRPVDEVATRLRQKPEALAAAVAESRELLYRARSSRPAPHRDDKIIAAWNGLMISAYARAALALGDESFAKQAARAADFVLTRMRTPQGRLLRSFSGGAAHLDAYLDDYAFLISGLLDVYEATGQIRWLGEAVALDRTVAALYEDAERGGFFMTSKDHEALIAREKPSYDGAEPSGNSVEALNLLRLYELTSDDRYRVRAERTLRGFGEILQHSPNAMSEMLLAVDFMLDTPKEVVIVTRASRGDAEPLLGELRRVFLPNRVLAVVIQGKDLETQQRTVPLLEDKVVQEGAATAYVCERQSCELPTSDPGVFARQIRKTRRGK